MKTPVSEITAPLLYKKKYSVSVAVNVRPFVFFLCYSLLLVILVTIKAGAQNVGIDMPAPLQKLDVNGAIKIGTSSSNQPGTMRFNNGKFEGGDGTNWKSLEGAASGIVGTKIYNNPALLNAGYSLFGEIPDVQRYNTSTGLLSGLHWWPTYTRGIISNMPPPEFPTGGPQGIAVWDGTLMYVPTVSNLYTYNPITDLWSIVSNQGFSSYNSKAVWTGSEIVFWSGSFGKRYNPATNIWTDLPIANAPSVRSFYTMIWDGSRVIIWGGSPGGAINLNTGAMYNPATNIWTTMNITGAPEGRFDHTAVWNNTAGRMIVWGGATAYLSGELNTGGIFDPAANTWTSATNTLGAPALRTNHTAIWTGTEMIVFGGSFNGVGLNSGGKYNPSTNTWSATQNAGFTTTNHSALWTGTEMFITGGKSAFGQISLSIVYTYNPLTNLWTSTGGGLPFSEQDGKESHNSFLAGNMILIWGGVKRASISQQLFLNSNTGYRYFLVNTAATATELISETLYLYQKN